MIGLIHMNCLMKTVKHGFSFILCSASVPVIYGYIRAPQNLVGRETSTCSLIVSAGPESGHSSSERFWHKCSHEAAQRWPPGASVISRLSSGKSCLQTQSRGCWQKPSSLLWLSAGHISSLPHGPCHKMVE